MNVNIASEMHFNALHSLTQPCLTAYKFTKLCKLVYPWESVSEIQSIKETYLSTKSNEGWAALQKPSIYQFDSRLCSQADQDDDSSSCLFLPIVINVFCKHTWSNLCLTLCPWGSSHQFEMVAVQSLVNLPGLFSGRTQSETL